MTTSRGIVNEQGNPDINITAIRLLLDWQRGRIPFLSEPPLNDEINKNPKILFNYNYVDARWSNE